MTRVLAIDLGGSALKACLFEADGSVLASANVETGFEERAPGHSEQEPALWWEALKSACERISSESSGGLGGIAAVALCGFTRTQVFLDQAGKSVRPALGFRDSRAESALATARRDEALDADGVLAGLNAFHPTARLLWLKENEAENWERTHLVLEPKDYLNLQLTGIARSDHVSQHWLAQSLARGDASAAARLGLERALLPPLGQPEDIVGQVREGLPGALSALAGAKVLCGSNDSWTAVAGLGGLKSGSAYCISGSSEVFGLLSHRRGEAEGLITIPWGEELWHLGGPGQNGANLLTWIVDGLDATPRPFQERLAALLGEPENPRPLLFHPYLHGERTPFWDGNLAASFLGMTSGHGRGDLVRAVMQGVGFLNRTVLERAETATGLAAEAVRMAGGGTKSPLWNQMRADILGRPVLVSRHAEMGLAGCFALCRVALGFAENVGAAAPEEDFTSYLPNAAHHAHYDALYALFTEMHEPVARAARSLEKLRRRPS
ncbi:FGGY-family carbohydrate kinase [Afifella sp. JA880]|uniref:xylulokinase n=1 Tax=Afifella sp. JA880 TaxID=2975280 RepID=UPI0021BB9266|nr:FGGY-family carbohydrate kinase [Afifella sp. JA880]MCT8266435.1 FGGY-family carbohydrate kinase [Afifella sp. JA880]